MTKIYLSYSHKDRRIAEKFADLFKSEGLNVGSDHNVEYGAQWSNQIRQAIKEADHVVALWSPAYSQSEWGRAEAVLAVGDDKLIPILVEHTEIPLGFSHIHFADLSTWNGDRQDPAWRNIINAIQRPAIAEAGLAQAPQPDRPGARVITEPGRAYKRVRSSASTPVFIAHASADKPKLRPIVEVLIDQGFPVWIDKPQEIGLSVDYEAKIAMERIYFGNDWKEDIRTAIRKAKIVLAFWSLDAVEGRREQFHYEVYQGMMQKKLHQCRIEEVEFDQIGMPYTFDHIADLASIVEREYHPELDYLMQDMGRSKTGWIWSFATGLH